MLLNHVSVGTSNVKLAVEFYDKLFATLGIKRAHYIEDVAAAYGDNFEFWVGLPSENRANAGNGTHIAFNAPDQMSVDEFYRVALAQGARCEGQPGLRPEYGESYYAAFVRDLDGNKIEAVHL